MRSRNQKTYQPYHEAHYRAYEEYDESIWLLALILTIFPKELNQPLYFRTFLDQCIQVLMIEGVRI